MNRTGIHPLRSWSIPELALWFPWHPTKAMLTEATTPAEGTPAGICWEKGTPVGWLVEGGNRKETFWERKKEAACYTGWWFQPTWKILVKMGIFMESSSGRGENKKCLKPPPSQCFRCELLVSGSRYPQKIISISFLSPQLPGSMPFVFGGVYTPKLLVDKPADMWRISWDTSKYHFRKYPHHRIHSLKLTAFP